MARKTPDYTRQAAKRKKQAQKKGQKRQPPRGSSGGSQSTARVTTRGAAAGRPAGVSRGGGRRGEPAVAPTGRSRLILVLCYLALAASAGLYVYGAIVAWPDTSLPGMAGRDAIVATAGMLSGLVTVALLFLLVNSVLHEGRRLLPDIDAQHLMYAVVFVGMFAGLLALSARVQLFVLGAGYTLTLLVFFLAVRPRMRLESQAGAGSGGGAGAPARR
ncbi:MAG: hypothetical protein FJ000_07805 [Actinobacteria bacterium]|nr:hypothetical protein [Actinomycetota bacterium]